MKALVGAPVTALSDTTTVGSVTSMEAFGGDTAIGCMVIGTNLKFGECLPPE